MEPTKHCKCGKLMIQIPEDRIIVRDFTRQQTWNWKCFACGAWEDGGTWQFKHELEGKRWHEANTSEEVQIVVSLRYSEGLDELLDTAREIDEFWNSRKTAKPEPYPQPSEITLHFDDSEDEK